MYISWKDHSTHHTAACWDVYFGYTFSGLFHTSLVYWNFQVLISAADW